MSTVRQGRAIPTAAPPRPRRLWHYGVVGILGVVLIGGGQLPTSTPQAAPPAAPQPMGQAALAQTPASPMDEPLRLLLQARQAHQKVLDYTCLLVKRERVNGVLSPENVMEMKVRTQPFSVYLRWLQPRSEAGQEVCYVAGRNDGKMRVRPRGVLGVAGFISLDPNDPRARQTSRRSITEAGIGGMIERFLKGWENERRLNQTQVNMADYEYNRRPCTRVETIHPTNPDGKFIYYRSVMYFDKEKHLPIRLECYDWPRYQGDPGEVVEIYSFANLRINVGLGDDVFNH